MSECKALDLAIIMPSEAINNIIYLDPKWDATTGKALIRRCYRRAYRRTYRRTYRYSDVYNFHTDFLLLTSDYR